jgi:spermidine synthase
MHYDDARHFVLTTRDKFDVITSDPIHPWIKGAATLYSKEYFEECKRHLNPGGVITQWVPLYESDLETVKSEIATFFEVFPNGTIWANNIDGQGYDVVLLGQNEPTRIDLDQVQRRLENPENRKAADSLSQVGFSSAVDLFSTYSGSAPELRDWLAGRADQSGPKSAPAVSGGAWRDLPACRADHAGDCAAPAVSRGVV